MTTDRITFNSDIFMGKPIIRGLRIKVENVLALLEEGASVEDILIDYPDLEYADIQACFAYARAIVANESVDEIGVSEIK